MRDHPGDDSADAPPRLVEITETWDEALHRRWQELKTLFQSVQDVRRAIERNEIATPAQLRFACCSWEQILEKMTEEAKRDYDEF